MSEQPKYEDEDRNCKKFHVAWMVEGYRAHAEKKNAIVCLWPTEPGMQQPYTSKPITQPHRSKFLSQRTIEKGRTDPGISHER